MINGLTKKANIHEQFNFLQIFIMTNLNNKLLSGLIIISVLSGCSVEQSKQEQPASDDIVLEESNNQIKAAETIEVEKKASCNAEPCTTVSIAYPRFESFPNFNKVIESHIVETLSEDFIMEADGSESIEELENMFIQSYEEFVANFPESQTPWDLSINITISYSSDNFLSLEMSTTSYTGGAHPNGNISYINLKKGNKKPLSSKDIIKNQKQLTKIAEAQFRDYYEIPVGEAFSDYGFTFENDEFSLPEAIGFSNNGMILYYNSYEIAPYANGPTDLTIPFSKLEGLLKI